MDPQAPHVDFGLALPNYRPGASAEGMAAAAETCTRLGWGSIWTTDHLLPDTTPRSWDYGRLYESLTALTWIGAQHPGLRLGTSVLVVPMRNAVVLARELATLDALSGGRLTVGVGVGWSRTEFENLGLAERFSRRGRYADETVALWRHLWSGSREPFRGRFFTFEDFAFAPLPAQGEELPIWVGGRSEAALRRAGTLGDGYQSSATGPSQYAVSVPIILGAAAEAGRPAPDLSARVRARFGEPELSGYLLSGTADEMGAEIDAFIAAGVRHFVIDFVETDPERFAAAFERFHRDVASSRMGGG